MKWAEVIICAYMVAALIMMLSITLDADMREAIDNTAKKRGYRTDFCYYFAVFFPIANIPLALFVLFFLILDLVVWRRWL